MEGPSDPDVVACARAGDKLAFEIMLRPTIAPGARLALAMLQDRTEAEDAVQEAAINAWRRLDQLRPDRDFKPWFLGIVANQCRTVRRTTWWSMLRMGQTPSETRPGPEAITVNSTDLRSVLLRLPPDQRAAVLLHFYLDLPLGDVAQALGISVPGVKSRINRALKRLRPSLKSHEVLA